MSIQIFDNDRVKELWENLPKFEIFTDSLLENELKKIFCEIKDINDEEKIFEFFRTLIKEKVLGVRIRTGALKWCTYLIGCRVGEFLKREKDKNIKKNVIKSISKTLLLIKKLQKFMVQKTQKKLNEEEIRTYFSICITNEDCFLSVRMVIIKLFSLLFPNLFIPVFKKEHYLKFLRIFLPSLSKDEGMKYYNRGEKLIECCKKNFSSIMTQQEYVYFLYFQGLFLSNPKMKKILEEFNFYSYPLEEQSIVGLFYTIIKSDNVPKKLKKFKEFQTHWLHLSYPDLFGKFKGSDELITIEFEYDLGGYLGHRSEEIPADYVICWENEKDWKMDKLYHNKMRDIRPKDYICIKDELLDHFSGF